MLGVKDEVVEREIEAFLLILVRVLYEIVKKD